MPKDLLVRSRVCKCDIYWRVYTFDCGKMAAIDEFINRGPSLVILSIIIK